jgi:hypothetical protein
MAILGLRGTGDWGTDERPKNFRESILWMEPNGNAPITALLAKARSESTDDPEFNWWYEKMQSIRVNVSAQATNTTATVTLTLTGTLTASITGNGTDLVVGDVLMVEPAVDATLTHVEYMVVSTAPTTSTQIIVTRAAMDSTIQTITTNTILIKVGNAYSEGSLSPAVTSRNPTKTTNLCQIFKTAYELTRTATQTYARTGDPLKNDKKRRMFDHAVAMEQAFLFGRRPATEGTGANGKPLRYTQGLVYQLIQAGRFSRFTATATEAGFISAFQDCFDWSANGAGDERLVIGGNSFLMGLNLLVKASGQIQFGDTVKLYGMNLARYITPVGNLYFRRHPLFNQSQVLSRSAICLDLSAVKYRYVQDTITQDNIQANDSDTKKGQWLTEAGLELTIPDTSKFIQNFYYP